MLRSSTERPAWTSTDKTGLFNAYKHRHRPDRNIDDCVQRNFYGHTTGFSNRTHAAELMEGKSN